MTSNRNRVTALAAASALLLSACSSGKPEQDRAPEQPVAASPIDWNLPDSERYHRLATYPVYVNRPPGADPTAETGAEISTVTTDGNTVVTRRRGPPDRLSGYPGSGETRRARDTSAGRNS
jgi:hypothetical protein